MQQKKNAIYKIQPEHNGTFKGLDVTIHYFVWKWVMLGREVTLGCSYNDSKLWLKRCL